MSLAEPEAARPARAALFALAVLTALNFLNYLDRYVLAAVLEQVRADPAFAGISKAQLGLLQSTFLWVYMVVSPIAGMAGRRLPRPAIAAAGVGLWSLATVGSGLASSYGQLLAARALIGFGEAGYATVAPAMLADLFARDRRNRVLSIFFLATPVGSAMGYIVGGLVAQRFGWRPAFFVAGAPGLAFALAALAIRDPPRGAQEGAPAARGSLGAGLRALANRDYLHVTAGMTLMTFAVGGLAYWMPTWLQEARGMAVGPANLAFGGIAVVAGTLGTLAGRRLGDAWVRRDRGGYLALSGWGLLAASPLALAMPFVGSLPACFGLLFAAELAIFVNTGPLNTALVDASPPSVRELGLGLNVLAIHALGDAISPPLLGAMADALRRQGVDAPRATSVAVAGIAAPLILGGLALLRGARERRKASAG